MDDSSRSVNSHSISSCFPDLDSLTTVSAEKRLLSIDLFSVKVNRVNNGRQRLAYGLGRCFHLCLFNN